MTLSTQTIQGSWNEVKGKIHERWGQLSDNEIEEARGNVDQLMGTIQRETGEAREEIEAYLEEAVGETVSGLKKVVGKASEAVHHVTGKASDLAHASYDKTSGMVQKRPLSSVAACFGIGLVTGVIIGLFVRSK